MNTWPRLTPTGKVKSVVLELPASAVNRYIDSKEYVFVASACYAHAMMIGICACITDSVQTDPDLVGKTIDLRSTIVTDIMRDYIQSTLMTIPTTSTVVQIFKKTVVGNNICDHDRVHTIIFQ